MYTDKYYLYDRAGKCLCRGPYQTVKGYQGTCKESIRQFRLMWNKTKSDAYISGVSTEYLEQEDVIINNLINKFDCYISNSPPQYEVPEFDNWIVADSILTKHANIMCAA